METETRKKRKEFTWGRKRKSSRKRVMTKVKRKG